MASKNKRRFLFLFIATFLCLGFRVYPGMSGWSLDSSTTAGRKVFITLMPSGKTLENNLPASDVLSSAGSSLTETQLLQSVIDDYNSIQRSNLILALDSDPDFAAYGLNHTIVIQEGSASGISSGEARPTFSGRTTTACKIILTDNAFDNAKGYVALVTHELGHCIGLEHPQETVWSVMSYFYNDEVYRRAIDDKMGIVHLYGKNSSDSGEKASLGLSCARQ